MNGPRNDTTQSDSTSITLMLARAQIYRWFSCVFIKPQDPGCSIQALHEALGALGLDGIEGIAEVSQGLASEFPRLFSHNLTPDCPPYETEYGSAHIFWQSQQLADIVGFYRAFGLELKETSHERVDHITVELEFMSYLALKEAYALERKSIANVETTQDAQRKFLKDHLGKWVKTFSHRIQKKLPGSVYANLAELLVRFIAWDCQRLGVQPEALSFNPGRQVESSSDDGCLPAPHSSWPAGPPCGTLGAPGCV